MINETFNKFKSHLNVTNKIRLPVWKMNQPYAHVNQPYATLTLASALREMFGVQLYKNNARALLSRILSILNLDWLQHVYAECMNYRLITAYLLLRVNLDKIMHAR